METGLDHLSKHDPVMRQLIATYPQPGFTPHTDYYHELVRSVIGQQLSVAAAKAIELRVRALYSGKLPSAEQVIKSNDDDLRTAGLSRPKIAYIRDLAEQVLSGTIRFDDIDSQSNDEIIASLTKVKGIGVWTVHMFLLFSVGRLDVLPMGDLGIRNGVTKLYNLSELASPTEVEHIAQKNNWRPYESIASWYVWQSLSGVPN